MGMVSVLPYFLRLSCCGFVSCSIVFLFSDRMCWVCPGIRIRWRFLYSTGGLVNFFTSFLLLSMMITGVLIFCTQVLARGSALAFLADYGYRDHTPFHLRSLFLRPPLFIILTSYSLLVSSRSFLFFSCILLRLSMFHISFGSSLLPLLFSIRAPP